MADGQTPKKRSSKQMTQEELLSIIRAHEQSAMGASTSVGMGTSPVNPQNMTTLELDNYNALNAYYARPRGDEQDDRSQIITPELRDTIEWVKPQLMRMFASTHSIVRFDPNGPDDEDLATQQTEACNHIFMEHNNGVMVLHDYIMDALLLRNGYVKVYYENKRQVRIETYSQLDDNALTMLLNDAEEEGDEIEILEQDEGVRHTMGLLPQQPPAPPAAQTFGMPAPPQPQQPQFGLIPERVWNIKLRRITTEPHVCVEAVPREEVLVSPRARSGLDDCVFYENKTKIARSDLIAQGYDEDIVNTAVIGPPKWTQLDDLARNDNILDQSNEDTSLDHSMQEPEFREVHLRVDWDGDGVAELRRVVIIGDKVADNEEVEEGNLSGGSPVRMAHRHIGISLYELLIDIQNTKTSLVRAMMDNVQLQNNTRTAIDQEKVNMEDMMTSRPGGFVRTDGSPMDKIFPLVVPNVIGDSLTAIEYWDQERQWRTGVGTDTTVLDQDALQDVTKGGVMAMLSKSDLKVELMARLLAEGLKDVFRKINNCIIRHQDKPMTMQLRGKWVEIDPSIWKSRTKISVNVGLGSGNREELRANLLMLGNLMKEARASGMVSPKNGYNYFKRSAEALTFNNPEEFFTDPQTPEGQQLLKSVQPPPPPQVQVAQIKAQSDAADRQQKAQFDAQQAQLDHQLATQQITAQQYAEAQKLLLEKHAEAQKLVLDHQQSMTEIEWQAVLKLAVAALQAKAQPEAIPADVSAARSAVQ